MTDRHSGYVVVLADDIRSDDAEATINAIKQIKGVIEVTPVVSDAMTHISTERMRIDLLNELIDLVRKKFK